MDYASVGENMKGYIVNREEVYLVEPDTRFFSKLAGKVEHGAGLIFILISC